MLLSLPSPPQDVESYIHRSGRTGRAGRTGVSMLFYKSQQEHMIPLVKKKSRGSVSEDQCPPAGGYHQSRGKGLDQVCVMCKEVRRPLPTTLSTFTCVHVIINDPLPYINGL